MSTEKKIYVMKKGMRSGRSRGKELEEINPGVVHKQKIGEGRGDRQIIWWHIDRKDREC